MSDAPQGPGWWMGEDGKFYPPRPTAAPQSNAALKVVVGIAAVLVIMVILGVGAAFLINNTGKSSSDADEVIDRAERCIEAAGGPGPMPEECER